MKTFVTRDLGTNFYQIDEKYRQIWARPRFALIKASQVEVARERNDGEIDDLCVQIVNFVHLARFATSDQIARGCNLQDTSILDALFRRMYLNKFVLSQFDDDSVLSEPNVMVFYTLDFAGDYLLSLEGEDMTQWIYTDLYGSARKIKKGLMQTEVLIGLARSQQLQLQRYQLFPKYSLGKKEVYVDFVANTQTITSGKTLNFAGYIVKPNEEALTFRDNLVLFDEIFKQTNAGKKYFPLGGDTFPHLLLIYQNASDQQQLIRLVKVLATTSQYQGTDVLITPYDQVAAYGLGKAQIFTYLQDAQTGKIQIHQMKNIFA